MARSSSFRTSSCLLPFPGAEFPELLAGTTPPSHPDGQPVDVSNQQKLVVLLDGCEDTAAWTPVWVKQVHGAVVLASTGAPDENGRPADGLITDRPGVLLVTRHADCLPVLLYDRIRGAVALLHSGRRGTLANISGRAVEALGESYGCRPHDLVASIGPGIRGCCYAVGADALPSPSSRLEAWSYVEERGGRLFLDLFGLVESQLRAVGVTRVHGADTSPCTCCGPLELPSYRRTGLKRTFAAVAGLRP